MSATKSQKLKYLADLISNCQKCPLYQTALNPVPGSGNPDANIVFIGEAPGANEDQRGLPFVGNSGKLLDKLLNGINLRREDVFIANILKHRPPGNRDPLPSEIKVCTPYLKAQLQVIEPKIIITLGRFAMNYFLPGEFISKVRGKIHNINWQGMELTLIPVYHPSAGLRNGSMLASLQSDFQIINNYLKKQKK